MEALWRSVLSEEEPALEAVEGLVEVLQSDSSESGLAELWESGDIRLLFERLEGVVEKEPRCFHPLALQSAYLKAVKAVMGKDGGLQRVCRSSDLVSRVALSLDSVDVSICTQVLELLAVLAVDSEEGFESVRFAMDYYRVAKKERVRFESLVEALRSDSTSTPLKRDVMLFVNALVNSAPDCDQRVEIRGELIRAGALEAIQTLKEWTLALSSSAAGLSSEAFEMEIQLQVFETVLENDHKTTLVSLDDESSVLKLDDVDSLFSALKAQSTKAHCDQQLLQVLQYLVAIPSFDALGKEQWAHILRAAHRSVLGVDDDFDVGFDEIKSLLSWSKSLEDRDGTIASLRNELKSRQTELDALKSDKELTTLKAKVREQDALIDSLKKQLIVAAGSSSSKTTLLDDPKYGKYFQMLKMHIPREAVENKMRAEGIDPAILNFDPSKPLIVGGGNDASRDPKYAKYFQMLKMHVPRDAVENKMRAEGLDPSVLDSSSSLPLATTRDSSNGASSSGPPLAEHAKYGKYVNMLKMHIPRAAVEGKMKADLGEGVNVKVLDLDPAKAIPKDFFGPPLKDDPRFGKYLSMVRMHIPRAAVEGKMRAEGFDDAFVTGLLDCDPSEPLPEKFVAFVAPQSKASSSRKSRKPNPKPRIQMKSLFWSKIDEALHERTVWKNLSDEGVELDLDSLELDFAKVKKKTPEEERAEKEKEEKKQTKEKDVSVVDSKVSQNVGIALKRIKMSNADLFDAIVRVDEGKLDLTRMELLLKSCPSPEDAALVADWVNSSSDGGGGGGEKNDPKSLGQVEAFFHTIAPIPDFQNRLECMVFKQKLEQTCEVLDDRLKTITAACEQVSRSERLAKLLEVVLKIGNYLNGGTNRGGVVGYKLDALAKLATVKSLDNQKSLMNWLVQYCERRDASLLDVAADFPDIDEAARCPLTQWQEDFRQLERKITLVQMQVAARRKHSPQKQDRFVEVMAPFREQAVAEAETLKSRFQKTEERFARLVSSFGEDPKTCGVEQFFKDLLGDFVSSFHKAHSQNQKRKAMEERAAQKKLAEEKKAALKAQSGELVTNMFKDLGNEAADDILAKLQGPREKRRAQRSKLAKHVEKDAVSPNSERMKQFIGRIQGHDAGTKAYEKLQAFRGNAATPAPQQSERASRAAAKLEAFRKKLENQNKPPTNKPPTPPRSPEQLRRYQAPTDPVPTPPKRASLENQPDLQALAGVQRDASASQTTSAPSRPGSESGGELLKRLQQKKERNKRRLGNNSSAGSSS